MCVCIFFFFFFLGQDLDSENSQVILVRGALALEAQLKLNSDK